MENKVNNEQDKVKVEKSVTISEKQSNQNNETFGIFSHIKEIKVNPNYDFEIYPISNFKKVKAISFPRNLI